MLGNVHLQPVQGHPRRPLHSLALAFAFALLATVLTLATSGSAASAQSLTCGGETVTIDMNSNGGVGVGTSGNDVIMGTSGDDTIRGYGGNDTICGGEGRDRIYGGDGDDHILGGDAIDYIWGEAGIDTLEGNGGSDRLRGGDNKDYLWGGSGADRMWGEGGDDEVRGQGGQDQMWGGPGNDTMQGNWQSDLIHGGPGDDFIGGAEGKDALYGDEGGDRIFGGNNTDTLHGGPGPDELSGGNGTDTLYGGTDVDLLNGGPHTDTCHRGSGDTMASCQSRLWEISDSWFLQTAVIDGIETRFDISSAGPARMSIETSTGSFTATSGCNSSSGTIDVAGTSLSVDVGGVTEIACDPVFAGAENALFVLMNEMTQVAVTANLLTLQNATGTKSITFTRITAKPPAIPLEGTWTLVEGWRDPCHDAPAGVPCAAVVYPIGAVAGGGAMTLAIEPNAVSGSGGCNSFGADRNLAVPFGLTNFRTTLIGCASDVLAAEQLYYEALADVTNVEISATTLQLDGGGALLKFTR